MEIYELKSEDLSNLGGPMGTESTSINYQKPFEKLESAKKFAENEYGKKIKWIDNKNDVTHSGDLGYVMYTIYKTKLG